MVHRITGRKRTASTSSAGGSVKRARIPSQMVASTNTAKTVSMKSKSKRRSSLRGKVKTRVARLERDLLLDYDRKYKTNTGQSIASLTRTAPDKALLNGLVRGDGQGQRIGNHIYLGKGHVSAMLVWHDGTVGTIPKGTHQVRVMVILRKDPNKTAFVFSDLFRSTTPFPHEFFDFVNKPHVFKQFRILFDRIFENPTPPAAYNGTNITSGANRTILNFGWDCRNYQATYSANTGGIADLDDGAVTLLMITNEPTASHVSVSYDAVQYFTEKKAY